MKPLHRVLRLAAASCIAGPMFSGCADYTRPSLVPIASEQRERDHAHSIHGYVYVSNRTATDTSELLVYPEGVQNPNSMRTIAKGLHEVGGIAVDPSGNVYVANGGAGNVLQFSPGGATLLQTYSKGIHHPISVAIAGESLYVSDEAGQVVQYPLGTNTPSGAVDGPGYYGQPNAGVAFGPSGGSGSFFVAASSLSAIPFAGKCAGSSYTVSENILSTLWKNIPLSGNQQVSGIAFDTSGKLFASDPCANDVAIYAYIDYTWTYVGKVAGSFDAPLFLTIDRETLAIPSDGTRSGSGKVTVVDLAGGKPTITISRGLRHPVGAAVSVLR